ncbi:Argininosuccinate lyase [Frankliniella fusca]|uniref:Argininosuccinate lyase n=1 Tax=Frankliniella fusca TaxID=407009 RepID=A0AAE1HAF5_9NEOP|nr:Argininosuccinate lyase [Frankliniella fusca]
MLWKTIEGSLQKILERQILGKPRKSWEDWENHKENLGKPGSPQHVYTGRPYLRTPRLKSHFKQLIPTLRVSEKCTKGWKLHALFQDPCNRLYLLFLKPTTAEIARVNVLFQGDNIEVTRVFTDLRNVKYVFLRLILKPGRIPFRRDEDAFQRESDAETILRALEDREAYLPFSAMGCFEGGFTLGFTQLLGCLNRAGAPDQRVDTAQLLAEQGKCVEYLHHLCRELVSLLPDSKLCEALTGFALSTALCPVRVSRFPFRNLPLALLRTLETQVCECRTLVAPEADIDELKSQRLFFDGEVPSSSSNFWCGVYEYRENGVPVFRSIANLALRVLSLPFLNAVVERAFSVMNAIKTKARNRMGLEILMAIKRIRLRVIWSGCCKKFEPTDEMCPLFNCSMNERVNKEPAPDDDHEELDVLNEVDEILPPDTDTGHTISITELFS